MQLRKSQRKLLGPIMYKQSKMPRCYAVPSDLDAERLALHVAMFHDMMRHKGCNVATFADVIAALKSDVAMRRMLPELVNTVRLILTIPVTTCTAERSFSSLRRLKTYLRSTMTQIRLNHVALLNCHRDYAAQVDIDKLMNEFIQSSTVRSNTFALK